MMMMFRMINLRSSLFRIPFLQFSLLPVPAARGAETPQYTTVHAESDFEVRLYRDTVWMSAPTPDIPSFHAATKLVFHR